MFWINKFQSMGLDFEISHLMFNVSQPGLLYMVKLLWTSQVANFKCRFYGNCTTFWQYKYFLKVYDLNFRMNVVVALCRKGVLSTQKIASRRTPTRSSLSQIYKLYRSTSSYIWNDENTAWNLESDWLSSINPTTRGLLAHVCSYGCPCKLCKKSSLKMSDFGALSVRTFQLF